MISRSWRSTTTRSWTRPAARPWPWPMSVNESLGNEYHYKYDRTAERVKRDKKEIGIQAIRGGSIVGEHDVIFAGQDEVVTFQHTAYSKAIFAKGAVQGAKFLAGKAPGMYDMADVIG